MMSKYKSKVHPHINCMLCIYFLLTTAAQNSTLPFKYLQPNLWKYVKIKNLTHWHRSTPHAHGMLVTY